MRRVIAFGVMLLLLFSTFSYPFFIAEAKGINLNSKNSKHETEVRSPSQAHSSDVPDIAVGEVYYLYVNNTHMRVYANITNYGEDSEAFNVTFKVILPQNLPQPAQIPFKWINITSELQNASEVHLGDYIEGGNAVLKADDGFFVYKLPFTLNYFGREIVNISVSTNGHIELLGKWEEPKLGDEYGTHEDMLYQYSDVIFALDDDLETEDGYLAVVQFGDKVVVEWLGSTYEDYDSSQYPVHFQVVIFRNGTIRWSYNLLRYSDYSYDLFAGYYSKVSMEENAVPKAERKSFEVQLPDISPSIFKVSISGLSNGASTEVYITLPIQDVYVKVIADDEEILNESYRYDNVRDIGIWPGDYWIENVTIGNMTVGEYTTINVTVKTTSHHPDDALIGLMLNNQTIWRGYISWDEFINGISQKTILWRVQGGEYDLRLRVYAQGDLNTSNNYYYIGHYSLPQPNFRIVNYSIEIPQCVGSQAVIRANITNDGDGSWSYVSVRFTVGYETPESFWTTVLVPTGEVVQAQVSFDVSPGNISWIHIEIDPYNSVFESNESDNYVNVTYVMSIPYPDFTVDSLSVPDNLAAGNVYEINATILNIGGCYDGEVRVNLYEENYRVAYKYVTPNTTVSFLWRPRGMGYRNLSVVVNSYHSLVESNYSNNALSRVVYVQGPDLIITNVTLVRFDGIAGSGAVFNVTIKNLGEAFTSGFYIRTRNALYNDYTYISGGLKKGEERWTLLEPILNGGNYSLVFVADYWNDIPEANESNNIYSYPINIPMPNFVIEKVELPNNTVGEIPINVTIKNVGAPFNASEKYIVVKAIYGEYGQENIYIDGFLDTNETASGETTVKIQAPGAIFNVTVNPYGDINETSYSDNSHIFNYTTGYPDLIVEISVPENISAGESKTVNFTVRNTGNATLSVLHGSWYYRYLPLSVIIYYENGDYREFKYELAPIVLKPGDETTRQVSIFFNGGVNVINATVDANDRWVESNETNNNVSLAIDVGKPDFMIVDYSISQEVINGTAYLYKSYPIKVNITNLEASYENYIYVGLYDVEEDSWWSTWIYKLSPGETKEATVYYYPYPGNHTLILSADYRNEIVESHENNNNVTLGTLTFGKPELVPIGVTWEPYNFTAGEKVVFSAFVENLGQRFYRYFTVRFEIYNGTDVIAYGNGYPSPYSWYFDTNETKEFRWTWYNAKPGNLTLKVIIDYYNDLPELNETNNELVANLGSIGTPDFYVHNLTVEDLAYGRYAVIKANITNLGEGIYRPIEVGLKINDYSTYQYIYGIEANETKKVEFRWYVSKAGKMNISITADPYDEISEINEDNNQVNGTYYVEAPDLTISSYEWIEEDVSRRYITFKLNVTNIGGDDYKSFYVGAYVDNETYPKASVSINSIKKNETKEVILQWAVDERGGHNVTLKVDAYNAVLESREDNNEVRTSYYIEEPDLSVESVSVEGDMIAGNLVTFHVTVKNLGGFFSDTVHFLIYREDTPIKNASYTLTLGKNVSKIIHLSGVRLDAGVHNYTVKLIPSISEKSLANNKRTITLSTPVPDLEIQILNGVDEISVGMNKIDLRLVSHNAPARYVAVKLTVKQGNKTREILVPYSYFNPLWNLERDDIYEKTVEITLDPGEYEISALIDSDNVIAEENEDNNRDSLSGYLSAPDLRITGLRILGKTYIGAKLYYLFNITNNGGFVRGVPIRYEVWRNGEKLWIVEDTGGTIYQIEENSWREYDFDNTNLYAGNLTIKAWVDPGNVIEESNESNNYFETNITVEPIDAQVVDVELPEIEHYGWYEGNVTIKNIGINGFSSPYRILICARIVLGGEGKIIHASSRECIQQLMSGEEAKVPFRFRVDAPKIHHISVQLFPIIYLGSFPVPFPPEWMNNFDSNFTNNMLIKELNISVPSPDLVIVNYTYSPKNATEREPISFNVTVRNIGDGISFESYIRLKFGNSYAYLSNARIPALEPNEEYTLSFTAKRSRESPYGIYDGNITLMINSNFIEKNLTNNEVHFTIPIKRIPILVVDSRYISLDREVVITRPSVLTVPIRNYGHVGANVTIASEFVTFEEFYMPPVSSKYIEGTVLIPENRSDLVGKFITLEMSLSAPYNHFTFTKSVEVHSGAEPKDLVPKDKDIVNRVLFYWRTELPSNGTLYYRKVGDENWTKVDMGEGNVHTALFDVEYKRWYEYYIVSWNRFGNHTSEIRKFYTFRSLGFEKSEYYFKVKRDYNQFRTLNVLNPFDEDYRAEAVIESTYPDIAVGFITDYSSSWTAERFFRAHSNTSLTLGMHFQDARQWNYALLVSLQDERGIKDYAIVRVELEPVVFNITYNIIDENPYTLTKTVELINNGGNITDFYLHHSDKVVVDPELLHFNFREEEKVVVKITPVLSENFTSHTEVIRLTGANQESNFTLSFEVPEGKKVFKITPNITVEFFYPDHNPATNPSGLVPSYLYNGTPYFVGTVYVRVKAYGVPLSSMNVTLVLRNSTDEVVDYATTDMLGVATFHIIAKGGERYSYMAKLSDDITTEWRSFEVNMTPVKTILPQEIEIEMIDSEGNNGTVLLNSPYIIKAYLPNLSQIYNNRTLALLKIRKLSFPATSWVYVGEFKGDHIEFNVTNLVFGLYEGRVYLENSMVYATSKPFMFLSAPTNFTSLPRTAIYAFRQDFNGSIVAMTYEETVSDENKKIFIYNVVPYDETHVNLTLMIYTTENTTDTLTFKMFDSDNNTIYYLRRNYTLTAPLTLISLIVPKEASRYEVSLDDPLNIGGVWRSIVQAGGELWGETKGFAYEVTHMSAKDWGETLYLMAREGILTPNTKAGVIVMCAVEVIPGFGNAVGTAGLASDLLSAALKKDMWGMGVVGFKKVTGSIKEYAEGLVKDAAAGYNELFEYVKEYRRALRKRDTELMEEILKRIDLLILENPDSLMRMRTALALSEDILPSVKVIETTSETKVILNPGFRGAESIMKMKSKEFGNYLKWTIIREAKNMRRTLLDEPRLSRLARLSKVAERGSKLIPIASIGATLYGNYDNWRRVVKEGGGWFRAAVTYNIQTKATSRTSGSLWCLNQKDISGVAKPSFDNPMVGYILRKTLDRERVRKAIQRAVINLKVSEFEEAPPHDLHLLLNGIDVFDLEGVPAINREFMVPIDPEVIFPMSENEFSVLIPLYNPGYYGIVTGIQLEYIIDLSKLPIPLDELTAMYLVGSNLSEVLSYLNLLNREVYMSDGAIMHVIRSNEKGTENAPMLFLVELANKGNAETWTGVLTLYVNNTLVDAAEVGRLDPLESDYGMLTWIPNQSGTYDIEIRYEYLADSPVLDKDESNNVYRTEIEVLPAVPDFEITNVEFTALPGNVTISGTIENLGGYYNGSVELAVYVNNTLEKTLNETLGTFNVILPLDIGRYNITLIVDPEDEIEERNESNNVYSLLVEVKKPDTTPPLITINSPRSGIYGITEFDINVTVSDESNIVRVWAEFENESVELCRIPETSFWIGSVSLPEGNTTLTIKALDEAGNGGNASVWLLVDLTSPNISILSPLNRTYNTRNITFEFTVSDISLDSVETYLDDSSAPITSGETLEMDYGSHEFKVVATDKAGNIAEKKVVFRINKPPLVNFTWNANYLVVNFTSLSYDEDGEIVRFLWQFGDNITSEEANPTHVYHRGGVYNVTLRVWDNDNATSSLMKQIVVYASVVVSRTKEYTFERTFGFYNSTSWDDFREEFARWVNTTLSNITLPFMDEFEHVNETYVGEWVRVSYDENLSPGVELGWINATYERNSTIVGIIDHNVTTMFIHEIMNFYANATHVPDNNPPVIVIIYPESKTYDHNVTFVKAEVYDESPIKWVKAELDGISYNMTLIDGAWIANVTASDGNHTLTVTASDIYGNIGSANLSFAVNTSIRIIENGNTTVTVIPGEVESEVEVENDTVDITITLEGTTQLFTLPRERKITIDGRLSDNPWLAIYSNARMERTLEESEEVTRGAEVYNVRKITMEVNVSEGGYAVVMVPLRGMRPVSVVIEKNSTKYELTTKKEEYGYFGVFGNYLYIVIFDDPIIEVRLEQLNKEKTVEVEMTIWRSLGLMWKAYYLRLKEEFENLLSNVTNTDAVQNALVLHEQAEIYFNEAEKYDSMINPIMYSIYMRKAYITEKEALKLLKRYID